MLLDNAVCKYLLIQQDRNECLIYGKCTMLLALQDSLQQLLISKDCQKWSLVACCKAKMFNSYRSSTIFLVESKYPSRGPPLCHVFYLHDVLFIFTCNHQEYNRNTAEWSLPTINNIPLTLFIYVVLLLLNVRIVCQCHWVQIYS